MIPLLNRLNAHIAQMAPHHRDREGGKLLIDARAEIIRLNDIVERGHQTPSLTPCCGVLPTAIGKIPGVLSICPDCGRPHP